MHIVILYKNTELKTQIIFVMEVCEIKNCGY